MLFAFVSKSLLVSPPAVAYMSTTKSKLSSSADFFNLSAALTTYKNMIEKYVKCNPNLIFTLYIYIYIGKVGSLK